MWLSAAVFAELVEVSKQAARSALSHCVAGSNWRGSPLNVRWVVGRGGKSGLRYEVSLESLPADLQARYRELHGIEDEPAPDDGEQELPDLATWSELSRPARRIDALTEFRCRMVESLVAAGDANSAERAAKIAELAATERFPAGARRGQRVPARTLRRWVANYEQAGYHHLARKARADAGKRRVIISQDWDAAAVAAGIGRDAQKTVKDQLLRRIRSEWASGAPDSSAAMVQIKALAPLMDLSRAAGLNIGDDQLRRICLVPLSIIRRDQRFRLLALKKRDAGAFAATVAPRIIRDRSHLRPGQWVAADIHHVDVAIRRDDGSLCTPKLVAFYDLAVNKLFWRLFMMPKGESIRREHVIETFIAMCGDHDWGLPNHLYCDRGGEFNWLELFDALARLKCDLQGLDKKDFGSKRSLPYRPQGKVIEGLFAGLEKLLAHLPGHLGGDRMKKKCESLGKAPEPFNGDFEAFKDAFKTVVAVYHAKPQRGHLKGKSPNDRFGEFCAQGWTAFAVDEGALEVAFAKPETRKIGAGGTFSVGARTYYDDALLGRVGETVLVRIPFSRGKEWVAVFDQDEKHICSAMPDATFRFDDAAGADEQQRRHQEQLRQLTEKTAMTDPSDRTSTLAAYASAQPKPVRAPRSNVVHMPHAEFGKAARATPATPAVEQAADERPAMSRRQKYEQEGERLEFLYGRHRRRITNASGNSTE